VRKVAAGAVSLRCRASLAAPRTPPSARRANGAEVAATSVKKNKAGGTIHDPQSGTAGLSPFAQWSQACAERTSRRSNFAAGDFDTARQHMLGITCGRYDFSANRPSRFIDFGGANIRLGGTSIHT
jgi:hypothetical protein